MTTKTEKPQHSPLPFLVSNRADYRIIDADGNPVAEFTNTEDLEFVLRAANAHEVLIDSVKQFLGHYSVRGGFHYLEALEADPIGKSNADKLRAALKLAGAE